MMSFRRPLVMRSLWYATLFIALPLSAQTATSASSAVRATTPTSPTARLERAAAVYQKAKTLRATFEQTITNALTGNTSHSRGTLWRRRPNHLALVFSNPANDRIIADGSSVWIYLPSSAPNQVIKTPIANAHSMLIDPIGTVLSSSAAEEYGITDAGTTVRAGNTLYGITLTSRGTTTPFTTATVWVDSRDRVRQIDATEPSGLTRSIAILDVAINVTIPAQTFTFTPAPGIVVVER